MTTPVDQLISVIMIFRDAERFFDEAIESVLAQDHAPIELLLCDDGSTDASTAMALRWVQRHPGRVTYLEHEGHAHRGMSATRNLGLRAARGEVVAFLDADDVWEPGHLSHELALLQAHPEAELVCGQAISWRSWEDPDAEDCAFLTPWPAGVTVRPPQMLTALLRRGTFRTPVCNLLVRRATLTRVGGAEDEFLGQYEDQVLLSKLYLTSTCVISGARSARYRQHAGSSTARALRSGIDHFGPNVSREAFLRWLRGRPEVWADPDISGLIDRALEPYDRPLSRLRWRTLARVRAIVPPEVRPLLRRVVQRARLAAPVRLGSLRHVTPLSRQFGYDRGLPIDRHYIERFLAENAHAIAGRTLEIGDSEYTRRFGGSEVTQAEVLNIDPGHPETTIVADLADADEIESEAFDCLVITQTLHLIYDVRAAVRTLHRILRPGGTVLATFPGISPLSTDRWAETWYWALTPLSAARLFAEVFGEQNVEVLTYGNVLTSVAFLEGMASRELTSRELDAQDPQFPMLVAVRACRPLADLGTPPVSPER